MDGAHGFNWSYAAYVLLNVSGTALFDAMLTVDCLMLLMLFK